MPYKDKEKQRQAQLASMRRNREKFFQSKTCADCGSKINLGLFGAKSNGKSLSFSMSQAKLEIAAQDSKVLCEFCMPLALVDLKKIQQTIHGYAALDNEGRKDRTYRSWECMKARCTNENHDKYEYYGGRGIKICQRWLDSFENFLADMGERPEGRTLDRIDPDGNYEADNCRWATPKMQANNKRNSKKNRQVGL